MFFSNDEIIIDITGNDDRLKLLKLRNILERVLFREVDIPLKVKVFKLHKIKGISGYYEEIYESIKDTKIELKCVDNYMMPFVLRKLNGEHITENDKVFYHEGLLAKFIEVPEIEV